MRVGNYSERKFHFRSGTKVNFRTKKRDLDKLVRPFVPKNEERGWVTMECEIIDFNLWNLIDYRVKRILGRWSGIFKYTKDESILGIIKLSRWINKLEIPYLINDDIGEFDFTKDIRFYWCGYPPYRKYRFGCLLSNMKKVIEKNNVYIMEGKVVVMNLNQEEIDSIIERWKMYLGNDSKYVKLDDKIGVGMVDMMMMVLHCKGNLGETARRLNLSRYQIKELIEGNKTLLKIYTEIESIYLDYVEFKLSQLVDKGDRNAIQYFLNAKGRERGYGTYEARRRVQKIVRGGDKEDFMLD